MLQFLGLSNKTHPMGVLADGNKENDEELKEEEENEEENMELLSVLIPGNTRMSTA